MIWSVEGLRDHAVETGPGLVTEGRDDRWSTSEEPATTGELTGSGHGQDRHRPGSRAAGTAEVGSARTPDLIVRIRVSGGEVGRLGIVSGPKATIPKGMVAPGNASRCPHHRRCRSSEPRLQSRRRLDQTGQLTGPAPGAHTKPLLLRPARPIPCTTHVKLHAIPLSRERPGRWKVSPARWPRRKSRPGQCVGPGVSIDRPHGGTGRAWSIPKGRSTPRGTASGRGWNRATGRAPIHPALGPERVLARNRWGLRPTPADERDVRDRVATEVRREDRDSRGRQVEWVPPATAKNPVIDGQIPSSTARKLVGCQNLTLPDEDRPAKLLSPGLTVGLANDRDRPRPRRPIPTIARRLTETGRRPSHATARRVPSTSVPGDSLLLNAARPATAGSRSPAEAAKSAGQGWRLRLRRAPAVERNGPRRGAPRGHLEPDGRGSRICSWNRRPDR